MIMEIGNIIHGTVNELFGINQSISQKRLNICYSCPLYVAKLGGICNSKLWLNQITGDISSTKKDGYENGCGCRLQAKTKLPNAVCPLGKW